MDLCRKLKNVKKKGKKTQQKSHNLINRENYVISGKEFRPLDK